MGKVQLGLGQPDEAIESFRRAMAIMEKPPQSSEKSDYLHSMTHFFRARVWALRCSAVGQGQGRADRSGAGQRRQYADQAMEALKQSTHGFIYPGMLKYEHEFDVLKPRDDFQGLIRELEERVKATR